MIKYYCDLCGQPCDQFTSYTVEMGKLGICVTVMASELPSEPITVKYDSEYIEKFLRRHLCNDCAIKAAGQALGLLPSPTENPKS